VNPVLTFWGERSETFRASLLAAVPVLSMAAVQVLRYLDDLDPPGRVILRKIIDASGQTDLEAIKDLVLELPLCMFVCGERIALMRFSCLNASLHSSDF
jgi:hypothetical protein